MKFLNRLIILLEIALSYVMIRRQNLRQEHKQPHNILIFAYMGLGDAIMMLPMLRAVKETYPAAQITALTTLPSPAHEILRLSGCVDTIEFFNFKQSLWKERWALINRLKKVRFDLVFSSYVAPVPYFVRLLADIPLRIGHVPPARGVRNMNLRFLWTHSVPLHDNDKAHETTRYLALAEALGIPTQKHRLNISLTPSKEHEERAVDALKKYGVGAEDMCIGFHPAVGVTMPWRQWGVEKLIQTAQELQRSYSSATRTVWILLFGSNADKELLEEMSEALKPNVIILIPDQICHPGDIPLSMTMALLRRCSLLIANDGGIAHLATACGTPLVRIFGMADYHGYKALQLENGVKNVDVWKGLECSPCMGLGVIKPGYNLTNCGHRNCLQLITVQEVVRAAEDVLPLDKENND